MAHAQDLTKAIVDAKQQVKKRHAETASARQDPTLRGLRKTLRRLQRRRRALTAQQTRLTAKMTKPATEAAKAG